MPREKNQPAADEAAAADVQQETQPAVPPAEPADASFDEQAEVQTFESKPAATVEVETGEEPTAERTVYARNSSSSLLTLEDGTPFPANRKKWLTGGEAARFSQRRVIVVLS